MKRKHSLTYKPHTTYFITTTITEFTRLFSTEAAAEILIDNINFYISKLSIKLHGFVVMPNHMHLLITTGETGNVSQFLGRLKERTAKSILRWCEETRRDKLLKIFEMSALKYKTGSRFQIWQERFDALEITAQESFDTKLNYIHNNPLQEKWRLCDKAEDYKFSSARYYLNNEDTGIPITVLS